MACLVFPYSTAVMYAGSSYGTSQVMSYKPDDWFSMLLKLLLSFLCGATALATGNSTAHPGVVPLLLVSFDGFRADYLKRFPMPNLKLLYSQGVLVEHLNNVFITKTFPNHYSLVTGLYAESHGILASSMYDPVSHKHFSTSNDSDPMWWSEAQPLWITALDGGYKTATMMWPGSDVVIGNRTATHFAPYNSDVTFKQRLKNVTNWILGNEKCCKTLVHIMPHSTRIKEQCLQLSTGRSQTVRPQIRPRQQHSHGHSIKRGAVDDNIGLLIAELTQAKLWGRINVIVTSDHGMAQCSAERLIRLDDCLHPDNYTQVDLSPVAALIPKKDPQAVFHLLNKCHPHMTAYMKEAIPDRLHYKNNERIQPILLIADEGWTIVHRKTDKLPRLGDHGYDNSLPSMHPFLAATGPGFRQGYQISSLQSVDIYPLMCHLLSVPAQPNNGTLTHARCLLAAVSCWDVPLMVGLVVGVLLVLTTLTVLFRMLSHRRPSGPRPFQRLQVDDDDDDPLLE
ncbi:hypothetical protein INR49_026095 [Caranx melampygus]|nr:hypothetical protein INR49_026095 [Caranx melampygus]